MSLLDDIDFNSDSSLGFEENFINFDEINKYYNYNLNDTNLKNNYKVFGAFLFLVLAVYNFHFIKIRDYYSDYKNRKLICYY